MAKKFIRNNWGAKPQTTNVVGGQNKLWSLNVKSAEYDEKGNLVLKIGGLKTEDVDVVNKLYPSIFKVVPGEKFISKFIINKDKVSDFDSVSDVLENTLIQTKHYVDSSVSKMIDSIEKFIATTPTNDEIEANDKIIAKNWRELLGTLNDPEVRKKFLLFQTTSTCHSKYSDAALSPGNVAMVLAADPDATFVTDAHTWQTLFKRKVLPGAQFVIIVKAENSLPMHILNNDPEVIKAGGWNALVKASGGKIQGAAWAAVKRAKMNSNYKPIFYKTKVVDVRFTQPINPNDDPFMKLPNLINNLTGEINKAAQEVLNAENAANGITEPIDYQSKREGLDNSESLTAYKDFIFSKCSKRKLSVRESGDIKEDIANAVYAYSYDLAEDYNKLNPKARNIFASVICAAVAATMNIDASKVSQSFRMFANLSESEKTDIANETFGVYKSLISFSLNEDINEQVAPMSYDEYVKFIGGNPNGVETMINENSTFKPMSFNEYKNFIFSNNPIDLIKEDFNKIMKRLDEVKF